jgi:hypothetical protein
MEMNAIVYWKKIENILEIQNIKGFMLESY